MSASVHNNIVYGPEEELIPAHISYGQFIYDKLKKGGDKTALINAETGENVTYKYILQCSVNLAVALKTLGVKKGDIIALSSENRFEFFVASNAIIFCGAILSTLNVTYSPGELKHIIQIVKPKYIFSSAIVAQNLYDCAKDAHWVKNIIIFGEYDVVPSLFFNELVKKYINIDDFILDDVNGAEDAVAVMCSSGTTGLPKGVMLTHVNFLTLSAHMKYYLSTAEGRGGHTVKTSLSLIPWFHAYGFITTMAIMCMNIEVVFLTRFDEQLFLESIQRYKVNMTTIVPPLAVFLAKHPLVTNYDLTSLCEIWCGAAPLSSEIQKMVAQRTGIHFIKQGYGLTEVTMACCVDLTNGEKIGSCGTPAPGMRIKVLDLTTGKLQVAGEKGELWIKSPLRMKGYMNDHEASDALVDSEGYLRTGDIGYYDRDGYFYIVDRLKELIKYKGFQVAPAELEALLLQHPGIADCGVVGKADEIAGELPTAFVVRQLNSDVTESKIVQYVAERMSPAKHLRGGVIFLQEIPKNASGKILRRELKAMLQNKLSKL